MSFLAKYDFNKPSGWLSVVFVSVAISLLVFAGVYANEGLGWLNYAQEDPSSSASTIGGNWIRGAVISASTAIVLVIFSLIMLGENKNTARRGPLWNRLDLNSIKGLLALVFFSVSFVFFLNFGLYRLEIVNWFYGAIATADNWQFEEASAWATAATTMAIVGIVLSALGWLMLVLAWKRTRKT